MSHGRRRGWREPWPPLCPAEGPLGHSGSDLCLRNSRYPHQPFVLKESTPIPPPPRPPGHWRTGLLSLPASQASPWGKIWEGFSEPEGGEGGRSQKRRGTRGQLTLLKIPSFPEECRRGFPPRPGPTGCIPTRPHPRPLRAATHTHAQTALIHACKHLVSGYGVCSLNLHMCPVCHVAVEGHRRVERDLARILCCNWTPWLPAKPIAVPLGIRGWDFEVPSFVGVGDVKPDGHSV